MDHEVKSSNEAVWRSRLRRFKSSGMSVTQFCRDEGVSVPSFYQWRKRLAREPGGKDAPLFVPVHVTQSAAVEIRLPNGTRISVPPGHVESLRVAIETAGRVASGAAEEVHAC
jgi:transposase-like protein